MNISVFGGSQSKEGDASYAEAYELGKLLALAGHTVLTGGYIGMMEAVSRGANEAGGHVIGVTCADIEAWRAVKPNTWVKEERRFATLQERLNELVLACDAAIALPGGPGTLTEIALTWNLMIINSTPALATSASAGASVPPKPLILVGSGWKSVMELFYTSFDEYIPQSQRILLQFAPNIQAAVGLLANHH